jgi:plastocyanin
MTEVDSPFANFLSDPDADLSEPFPTDAPYKFGPGFLGQPTPPCGADAASQCAYNGHNSDPVAGVLFAGDVSANDNNFYVRIDANPGETLWAIGEFGGVSIKSVLRIQVVADNATATTQAEIDAAKAQYGALEKDTALALDAKLRKMSTKHKTKSGVTVWDAFAGFDTGTIALLQWYPNKLVIHKGDKVRWHWEQGNNEDHGTGFPFDYGKQQLNEGVVPVCDPDGDNGDGPDTFTVDFETFSCPQGDGDLELDLQREFIAGTGDGKFPGGHEGSGIRGANLPETADTPGTDAAWDVKFTKTSPDKGFKYLCTIHGGFMKGFVVVKP